MSCPADLTAEDFKKIKLAEYRVRCMEAIFSGGSVSQRDNITESAQKLYDFAVKGLFDEEKKE